MPERTMPICFTKEQLEEIEKYAKVKRMINPSQAVEDIINNNKE